MFLSAFTRSRPLAAVVVLSIVALTGSFAEAQSGPGANAQQVADAVARTTALPANGAYQPNWNSLQSHGVPDWFYKAKFGIMMHWGVYSAPAKHNEWDEKYMYGANSGIRQWYIDNFGRSDTFGYLDFLDPTKTAKPGSAASAYYKPFTANNWNPDQWAALFKQSGAKVVSMTAQHHDAFALWDSQVTPYNTKLMGPKRDLVGDLSKAVRAQGLKFGVQDHGIENYTFLKQFTITDRANSDIDRPDRQPYYMPSAKQSPDPLTDFLVNWYERNVELINKYQPDLMWYDNGMNDRLLDPLKTKLSAYYYNQSQALGKEVIISGKGDDADKSFLQGAIHDHEKMGRAPTSLRATPWLVHDTLTNGNSWCYNMIDTPGVRGNAGTYIRTISHVTSLNGVFLLNIGPGPDGIIPQAQQDILTGIGDWMADNGEAIYDTKPWKQFAEGSTSSGTTASTAFRFTLKGNDLYAIMMGWPTSGSTATILSLGTGDHVGSTILGVELLGHGPLTFTRDDTKLLINLPPSQPSGLNHVFSFKITGAGLVPEPSTLAILGLGAAALMRRRNR
ncbi:MAG: alpha-L-fucosidase [Burkholderiales bacterium]|nr:alpha-L-fucosidase [Phycisphaerae bacterium]